MSAAASFARSTAGIAPADLESTLTPRQLEVLALVASGYSYADIARMKFYSMHTVQKQIGAALKRTGARSTTNLVAMMVDVKLIRRNSDGDYHPDPDLRIAEE